MVRGIIMSASSSDMKHLLARFSNVFYIQTSRRQVVNNRIIALCFENYSETLHKRIEEKCRPVDKHRCLQEIHMDIKHMHTHGYAHNDINPHYVMFNADGRAVLIDFDSSRPLGQKLGTKSGTNGFYDKNTTTSEATNDYYGLEMIEKYLNESVA